MTNEESICCPPQVDTFLANTKVKPQGIEKRRMTVKEKNEIAEELDNALDTLYPSGF